MSAADISSTLDSASSADSGWPEDAVEVGRIVGAWGLKGWIKVQPFASDPLALLGSRRWFVLPSERTPLLPVVRPRIGDGTPVDSVSLKITQAKAHGDLIVASAQEVPDRLAAEALRGARLFIGRASFPTAGPDEFYWVDLIGLTVVNRDAETLGSVVGLLDTGPHSVLRVASVVPSADTSMPPAERLIPFVASYIDEVSLEQRRISVDWGLDY